MFRAGPLWYMTTFFKNYSFEYNAQRVDIFKSTVVCSVASETDDFREGTPINIDAANFFGLITSSKNSGERLSLDIVAESWARELRNMAVTEDLAFRQTNAIRLVKDHLIPESWDFEYPSEFDTSPRYISYILRNGNYLSHISTILDTLGLDYTIYSEMSSGSLRKVIKSYYRDNFDGRDVFVAKERVNIGNLSVSVDYGKLATSIVAMGAESEQGINQTVMDAEMGDWSKVPRIISIKDTVMKKPEMDALSKYFWYYPASDNNPNIGIFSPDDLIIIDSEQIKIDSIYYMRESDVASWVSKELDEEDFTEKLRPISEYLPSGVIVASVASSPTEYIESAKRYYTFEDMRTISRYFNEPETHAIFDDIYASSFRVSSSDYFTYNKNLPSTNGFLWIGNERIFYRTALNTPDGDYDIKYAIRGVPTCATASCQHCGTKNDENVHVCVLLNQSGYLYDHCELLKEIRAKFTVPPATLDVGDMRWCPLCFDTTSVCPAMKCPHVKNDFDFRTICPASISKSDIQWTSRYQHHPGAIVFPASYYIPASPGRDESYEIYAPDSLIHKYGYLPTRVSAKGIADLDTLDKFAEGRLRLSALPTVGKFTIFNYDPWMVPASAFPGDVVQIEVATHGRFDQGEQMWVPTYWFDTASVSPASYVGDPVLDNWVLVSSPTSISPKWVQVKKKFVIQKTTKTQRSMPEVTFGAGDISFQDVTDYIAETMDVTSQRHRNQDPSKIIAVSDNGFAAQIQNLKTGAIEWVRMVK